MSIDCLVYKVLSIGCLSLGCLSLGCLSIQRQCAQNKTVHWILFLGTLLGCVARPSVLTVDSGLSRNNTHPRKKHTDDI